MKSYVYCIKDEVADRFLPIFEADNDEVAIRDYRRSVLNNKEINPADYVLLRLGWIMRDYSNEAGSIMLVGNEMNVVVETGGKDG